MLKRKYGDYRDWKRVVQKRFASAIICSKEFIGHVTLIKIVQVTEPLIKNYGESSVCIADKGYKWLQYFPKTKIFRLLSCLIPAER
ncbi:putative RNA-binding protein associated with RNAse of E/G family [Metabacillus sp. SLBN-84]